MKKAHLLLVFLVLSKLLSAQDDQIQYLIDSLIRVHDVKEMRTDMRSISLVDDSTYLIDISYFDERGNRIESIAPGSRNRFERRIYRYDTLDRRTLFREYDKTDTTLFYSETKWVYQDSTHYRKERYYEGELTSFTEYEIKTAPDTLWVIEEEHLLEYDKSDRKVSRYRYLGDTLQISEFIHYNDSLKLSRVDTYYELRRDIDTGYLVMAGQYIVKSDEWHKFYASRELMRDYYANPDKYIQMQLDGEFEMEYHDDPHTYQIYNYQDQLVQDGYGIYKSTYAYNQKGQLIEITKWGEDREESYGPLVETHFTFYEYDDKGFPIKMVTESLERQIQRIYTYTYSFR